MSSRVSSSSSSSGYPRTAPPSARNSANNTHAPPDLSSAKSKKRSAIRSSAIAKKNKKKHTQKIFIKLVKSSSKFVLQRIKATKNLITDAQQVGIVPRRRKVPNITIWRQSTAIQVLPPEQAVTELNNTIAASFPSEDAHQAPRQVNDDDQTNEEDHQDAEEEMLAESMSVLEEVMSKKTFVATGAPISQEHLQMKQEICCYTHHMCSNVNSSSIFRGMNMEPVNNFNAHMKTLANVDQQLEKYRSVKN